MRNWTIRTRLTVLYGGLFLLAGAALLAVTYVLVQHSLDARLGAGRAATDFRLAGRVVPGEGPVLRTPDGREISIDQAFREAAQQQRRFRDDTLDSLLEQGSIALGGVGTVALGFGWLMADRVLRPLHRITETANRVADRSLHERIGLSGPNDEIRQLADTFDSMLERLDRAFDGQRRFVANASHELRTPLAINRTLIEVALSRPDAPSQVRQLGETLLAVNLRHERLIDGLLTLARSEQAVTARDPVDLADIAGHVLDQVRPQPPAPQPVEIRTSLRPAPTSGEPVLLERVVQNLIQNAVDYNVPGGWVSVDTGTVDDLAELTVANTGRPIPGYEVNGLFEPFHRLRERVGSDRGTGLGLSIVRSVTRAHGGEVTATPREGGGLVVRVTLPLRRG